MTLSLEMALLPAASLMMPASQSSSLWARIQQRATGLSLGCKVCEKLEESLRAMESKCDKTEAELTRLSAEPMKPLAQRSNDMPAQLQERLVGLERAQADATRVLEMVNG